LSECGRRAGLAGQESLNLLVIFPLKQVKCTI
jgi:hypothetical protein